jgi:U3 small nucleolar RNA-associated protein 15
LIVVEPSATSTFKTPIIISAGGTSVKLWDPQLGTCLSTIHTKHSKTITSVCVVSIIRGFKEQIDGDGDKKIVRRLMTAGLDGLIRIHSLDALFDSNIKEKMTKNSFQLPYIHGVKTSLPITSLAMSPDSTRLVVGTSTGFVTVRQRAKYVPQGVKRKSAYEPKAGTYSHFMRGASVDAEADDHVVQLQKKKKLRTYDTMLQKFRYGDALDEALASRDPRSVSIVWMGHC